MSLFSLTAELEWPAHCLSTMASHLHMKCSMEALSLHHATEAALANTTTRLSVTCVKSSLPLLTLWAANKLFPNDSLLHLVSRMPTSADFHPSSRLLLLHLFSVVLFYLSDIWSWISPGLVLGLLSRSTHSLVNSQISQWWIPIWWWLPNVYSQPTYFLNASLISTMEMQSSQCHFSAQILPLVFHVSQNKSQKPSQWSVGPRLSWSSHCLLALFPSALPITPLATPFLIFLLFFNLGQGASASRHLNWLSLQMFLTLSPALWNLWLNLGFWVRPPWPPSSSHPPPRYYTPLPVLFFFAALNHYLTCHIF